MAVIKIDVEKPSQDFEIAGNTYTMYWDDESIGQYLILHGKYQKVMNEKVDFTQLDKASTTEKLNEYLEAIKECIEKFFGEGSFDEIYQNTGKSMVVLGHIMDTAGNFLFEKVNATKKEERARYTRKKK